MLSNIWLFKQNDIWGNPELSEFPIIGKISPTTLRYIKTYAHLNELFGKLDGLTICEIGVGYGGQCRVISSVTSFSEYILVDIKPALMLTRKYLSHFSFDSDIKYKTMEELDEHSIFDLVISNYAYSELRRNIQDEYIKKIILKSKKGI